MMRAVFTLALAALFAVVSGVSVSSAASPREIEQAIQKGAAYLKGQYGKAAQPAGGDHGVGPMALAGLAMLEAGVSTNEPAIRNITAVVREASYGEGRTYQVSLALMFLDRHGDPADIPLVQMLGVRLMAGQGPSGGWGYDVPADPGDAQRLKAALRPAGGGGNPLAPAGKDGPKPPARLHPEVERYMLALRANQNTVGGDDNSNTQFAVIALWMSRKHGVPIEGAMDLVVRKFLGTQTQNGTWPYSGGGLTGMAGASPSMICAGLIGLSTGIARREERRAPTPAPKKDPPAGKDGPAKGGDKSDDPFFNPPAGKGGGGDKKGAAGPARPLDAVDLATQRGLAALGQAWALYARGQLGGNGHGHGDYYFLWSTERVGVIFGVDKIGGVDWYETGVPVLLKAQAADGSWGGGGYEVDVNTAFAILFLTKSNVVRDLSSKVQKETNNELRSAPGKSTDVESAGGGGGSAGGSPAPTPKKNPDAGAADIPPTPGLPTATADEGAKLAAELVKASGGEWERVLDKLRDGKGSDFTRGLVLAIHKLDGDKKKEAREALAERLTRMTAETLRAMMKNEDPELRRGAALAAAMKDDKAHVPDLIDRLTDDEETVVRAAKAGLKSLTGQDHGPANGATAEQKKAAADAWRAWWAKQK